MTTRATKSYEHNAICDVCGFKFKASQLKQRWDGPMVCEDDWESRNILDFYRQRNDSHKLPFIRYDNQRELTWTPILTNISGSISTTTGTYIRNGSQINWWVQITPVSGSTTTSASGQVSLPIESVSSGTVRTTNSAGKFYGTSSTLPASTVTDVANWTSDRNVIIISGTYGV